MASNSETGHAVNIANFKTLIDNCTSFGVKYNPSNGDLKLTTMTTQYNTAKTANSTLNTTIAAAKEPINSREILFEPLNKLVTRIIGMLNSTKASANVKADAKGIADKIRGFGTAKPKGSDPKAGDFTSTSQQSYVQKANFFEQLIELLKTVTDYTPNETELQTTSLDTLLTDLETANEGLGSLLATAMTAKNTRDNTLYAADAGIVDVALSCKDYVKGLYGTKAPEYKMVSGIKFTRKRNQQ